VESSALNLLVFFYPFSSHHLRHILQFDSKFLSNAEPWYCLPLRILLLDEDITYSEATIKIIKLKSVSVIENSYPCLIHVFLHELYVAFSLVMYRLPQDP
jgi:hypothetical protein